MLPFCTNMLGINKTVLPYSNIWVIKLAFIGKTPEMGNSEDKTEYCIQNP